MNFWAGCSGVIANGIRGVSPVGTEGIAFAIMPKQRAEEFIATSEADFAYSVSGVGRFRVNVMRQRGSVGLVLRRGARGEPAFAGARPPPPRRQLAEDQRRPAVPARPTRAGQTPTPRPQD